MLNIFNLFLFLLALWGMFMFSSENVSWLYLSLGLISAALISFYSYRVKLIDEKSELLYLSFGFYRNFLAIYFCNFFSAIKLIFQLAFRREPHKSFSPSIHVVNLNLRKEINPALLATTINMVTGLFCISLRENEMQIHAVEHDYFDHFDFKKLLYDLAEVNDDKLI